MRSIGRPFLLALLALSVSAIALPTLASASNWTKEGKELSATPEMQWSSEGLPLGETKPITLQGPMKFAGEWGSIECSTTLNGTIGPAGAGKISEASVSAPSCVLSQALKNVGCKTVGSVTANELPWPNVPASSGGSKSILLGVNLTYALEGGPLCAFYKTVTVTGVMVAKPNNANAISSVALSGSVDTYFPSQSSQKSAPSGTLNVSPSTYGILTTDLVALSGTLGWSGSGEGMQCSVSGTLALEKGSEGKVISLNWSSCYFTGNLSELCGSVQSVTTGGVPLSAIDEGTKIRIPAFALTIKKSKCGEEVVSGELFATPNKTSAISSTALEGTLKSVEGWATTNRNWSGSVSWSPAGVYGL